MIVPSIDLQGGQAVQLVGGEAKAIDAGDPLPIAERFKIAGEIAVIDLDAAMRTGSNAGLVERLLRAAPAASAAASGTSGRRSAGWTRVRPGSSSAPWPSPSSCRGCRGSG